MDVWEQAYNSKNKDAHAVVIFISDGADNDGPNSISLRNLPSLQRANKTTLLTVAVGQGFPTTVVLDYLRPVYHTTGDDLVPLVFPIHLASQCEHVISQIEVIVRRLFTHGVAYNQLQLEDCGDDVQKLLEYAKGKYNACSVTCAVHRFNPVLCLDIIQQTKFELNNKVKPLLMAKMMNQDQVTTFKPTTSALLKMKSIHTLLMYTTELNTLRETAERNELCSRTDAQLQVLFWHHSCIIIIFA